MGSTQFENVGSEFDLHTSAEPGPDGTWTARLDSQPSGFGGTHGGYLSALGLRTMAALVTDTERTARSLTSHLLAPVRPGTVDLFPRLERSGTSMTSTSLRIDQDGASVAIALASFGKPRPSVGHIGVEMPDVPPPGECKPLMEKPVAEAGVGLLVEHRLARPPLPLTLTGGDRAEIVVWMRLVEERSVDALSAAMLADAGPPALYGRLSQYVAMPSTDITIHFADLAAATTDPWVLGVFRTSHGANGYATEDGELWTEEGHLVLQARQLRRILQPS